MRGLQVFVEKANDVGEIEPATGRTGAESLLVSLAILARLEKACLCYKSAFVPSFSTNT